MAKVITNPEDEEVKLPAEENEIKPAPEDDEENSEPEMKYRYACPACTNIAYYSDEVLTENPVDFCQSCGAFLGSEADPERFIPFNN